MNLIIHNSKKIRAELIRSSHNKQKHKGIKTIKTVINSSKNVGKGLCNNYQEGGVLK